MGTQLAFCTTFATHSVNPLADGVLQISITEGTLWHNRVALIMSRVPFSCDRDAIHDGLYLAMCHAKLADVEQATEWLERADASLTELSEDDPRRQELTELSQEASRLLKEITQQD